MLWGAAWWPLKTLQQAGAHGIALIMVCYSLLFVGCMGVAWRHRRLAAGYWPYLLGISLLGGAANVCFTYAMVYGDVIRAMVLFYLLPMWGVLGGRFILKEATSAWRWLGVVLAVLGAWILLGGVKLLQQPPAWVDLVALASGFFFAASNLVFRGLAPVPLAPKLAALFGGAAVIAAACMLVLQLPWPGQGGTFPWVGVCLYSLSWLLLANVGSQWAVTQMPAGRSSIIMIMELITAVATAVWIGAEAMTHAMLLGGAFILSATFLELWAGGKSPASKKGLPKPDTSS